MLWRPLGSAGSMYHHTDSFQDINTRVDAMHISLGTDTQDGGERHNGAIK